MVFRLIGFSANRKHRPTRTEHMLRSPKHVIEAELEEIRQRLQELELELRDDNAPAQAA